MPIVSLINPLAHQTQLLHCRTWKRLVKRILKITHGSNKPMNNTGNNLCVKWHYPEGKASVSDLRLEEKFGFEFKTEYIQFTPLTISKVLANSDFQTFLNRIISPESFLLWIFLGETKSKVMRPAFILVVATWKMDHKVFEFRLFLLACNTRIVLPHFSYVLIQKTQIRSIPLWECSKMQLGLHLCVYLKGNKR